jgi:Na+/proline symporter
MWQRMTSCKNPDLAVKSCRSAVTILFSLYVAVTVIGLLSPAIIGESKAVMIDMALKLPYPFLTALVIIGFIAAVTSTMDSSLNVGSMTLTRDIYQGFIRRNANETELLWASRIGLLCIAIPAITIAVSFQDIIHVLWMSADVYASAMFVPVVGILFCKNPKPLSGVLAMSLGLTFVLLSMAFQYNWLDLANSLPFEWPKAPYSTLIGVSLSIFGFQLGQQLNVNLSKTIKPLSSSEAA